MAVAVISDVHANLPALEAVLAMIDTRRDQLVIAGDVVGFGPEPAAVVDRVRSLGCVVLKGNVDDYVSDPAAFGRLEAFARAEQAAGRPFRPILPLEAMRGQVAWTRAQLEAEQLAYLVTLPFSVSIEATPGRRLTVVHANPRDLERAIAPDTPFAAIVDAFGPLQGDVLAFGHAHAPFHRREGRMQLVNVAAVGCPTDGNPAATLTRIEFAGGEWRVEQRRVPYPVEETVRRVLTSGQPDADLVAALLRSARRVRTGS